MVAAFEYPAHGGRLIFVGLFPGEVFYVPRRFIERDANLVHWSPQTAGGHFAACEQPTLFVEDIRRFARKIRS